ncbi:MAG: AMP-binding protein [Bacteroidetes bacterium]|nr:AMP-binding protein [Bacteroidota bacterium]
MNEEIKGLTLNRRFFTKNELLEFCNNKINALFCPDWQLDIYRFILDFLDDSEYILQKTSGTTGSPKIIKLSKRALFESAKRTTAFFQLKESELAVLCLPINYIAGKMMVVRALYAGLNLITIEPSGTPDFSNLRKIDFCAMVPMQASNLIEQNLWPPLKTLILGGAETNSELIKQLQRVNTAVFETYGMAETCSHIALKRLTGQNSDDYFSVLPGINISVDERGCLIISTPFISEEIRTNDCVKLLAKNKFKWLGRFDNVINSGGIKIQPEELEKQIQEILQIPCAVIGIADPLLGQKIVLIIESENEIDSSDILKQLALHINKKFLPKSITYIKKLPRNPSFKIDRIKLKELI